MDRFTPGHSCAYEVTGFTNLVLRRLVYGVRGGWTFTPDGNGKVIRWTYAFKTLRRRYWLVRHMLAPLWRQCVQAVLKQPRAWPRTRICAVDPLFLDAALITH